MKITQILMGGVLLGAIFSTSFASDLIDFQMKDQFDRNHLAGDYRGKPLMLLGGDRAGNEYRRIWENAITDSLRVTPDQLTALRVADLRGVPFFLKGFVKSKFPQTDPRHHILMDWRGVFAQAYQFEDEHANILIFDSMGRLVHQTAVTELDSAQLRPILNTLQTLMEDDTMPAEYEIATLGAGCFWCVEAVFQRLEGVQKVVSGYSGGHVKNPTYRAVCSGTTGHAEVVQITFDPAIISFEQILDVFWKTHDPTTLNRQGNDVGTQYRSVIFYHNETQKAIAEASKAKMESSGYYVSPIVTEITPFEAFYEAEDYHQNYYNLNGNQPYCRIVIDPKVKKLEDQFQELLKD